MAGKREKSYGFRIRIWHNPKTKMIHIASSSPKMISTVSDDPNSERYHKNLFRKFKKILKDEGRWPERQ